jgi:carotenoid cleavage dioxygenase-like enzyme
MGYCSTTVTLLTGNVTLQHYCLIPSTFFFHLTNLYSQPAHVKGLLSCEDIQRVFELQKGAKAEDFSNLKTGQKRRKK